MAAMLVVGLGAQQTHAADALGAYNVDAKETSISGISSGAFMAVQFATAWSSTIRGVGAIAGGPYFCAQGTALSALDGENILHATNDCMKGTPAPSLRALIAATDAWSRNAEIDDTRHLRGQKIYLFNGYNDAVVARSVTDIARDFYRHYLTDTNKGNLYYQTSIGAGHAQVTVDYGHSCEKNDGDFIDACGYDQAGILLQHIYGVLKPKSRGALSGRVSSFSQREFTRPASPASYSMADAGYVYVPQACEDGERCRVHIALHGCLQYADRISDRYVMHAGYNEWADTNKIIVLYPQTIKGDPRTDFGTPFNPNGCWDWWGYTNANYAVKSGRQIAAIKAMLDRLTKGERESPILVDEVVDRNLLGLGAIDSSDTAIALAWVPVAGAQAYKVYRATAATERFRSVGAVAGPSFGDEGLKPATSYRYKVTAIVGDGEGPQSTAITVATRTIPPRCDAPGSCEVRGVERSER
jgi:poly(3-hydroxybutyrate) depolymerase